MRFERILKMLNSRKNRKKGIHRNATGRFILFFDILCKIVYSIECAKKNNGGTPIWRPRANKWARSITSYAHLKVRLDTLITNIINRRNTPNFS